MPKRKKHCTCSGENLHDQINYYWLHFIPKGVCRIDLDPLFKPAHKKRHIYWYGVCPNCSGLMKYGYEFSDQNTFGEQLIIDAMAAIKNEELFGHRMNLTPTKILDIVKDFLPHPYTEETQRVIQSVLHRAKGEERVRQIICQK